MKLYINGHEFNYELEKLTRLFFPFEKIDFLGREEENGVGLFAAAYLESRENFYFLTAKAGFDGKVFEENKTITNNDFCLSLHEKEIEHYLAGLLFECYVRLTGFRPGWGILTGIRPAKLYRRFAGLLGEKIADDYFLNVFKVESDKLSLLKRTANSEDKIISLSKENSISLYVSIPFCPSRCSYCSFVSHSIEKAEELIPTYLNLLCTELEVTADIISRLNLEVMTVYIGGGTPTTLSSEQLDFLLKKIRSLFGYSFLEFTVEAGRPDTITREKLLVIKNAGVDRISINPQTMNDEVLKAVGRRHTSAETKEVFSLARSLGFDNINMDLIAGLPTDTTESFKDTMKSVLDLNPESVTVHSLSIKRSSNMRDGNVPSFQDSLAASEMVKFAEKTLTKNEILPYYMYRQSKTVGNLENIGYAKPQKEGIYNVYIMDETHTILACGASAVSKLKSQKSGKIERIFNYKYPYEYINDFDEILKRKEQIIKFYDEQY